MSMICEISLKINIAQGKSNLNLFCIVDPKLFELSF